MSGPLALLSPLGRELMARLGPEPIPSDAALRVGSALRKEFPADLVAMALTQHELRHRASVKFSRSDRMLFTRSGLEQATSEPIARHRAARFHGADRIADLCTGVGGDLLALAAVAPVVAVDRDPAHLGLAEHNAAVYGVDGNVEAILGDVQRIDPVMLAGVDAIFIDPARRTPDRRLGSNITEPPLNWCLSAVGVVPRVAIKVAPGIEVERVPPGWEIEFVADDRDLKEAVLWSPAFATAGRRATLLPGGDTLLPTPGDPVPVSQPGAYLLDPNPAVTRAGLVEDLARIVDGWKIDQHIAFLTADHPVRTPFARTLRVIDSLPWHQKQIAVRLRDLGIGAIDIRRRGLPGDVEQIRREMKLTGSQRATVVMTRVADRPWCFICTAIDAPEPKTDSRRSLS